jgi:hypothetical protein
MVRGGEKSSESNWRQSVGVKMNACKRDGVGGKESERDDDR